MSITSSNNSSENLPDESVTTNSQLNCYSSATNHLIGNGHNLSNNLPNGLTTNMNGHMSSHNSSSYPLYENSHNSSANYASMNDNLIKKNSFTTILEVPRGTTITQQQCNQMPSNSASVSTNNHAANNAALLPQRYSINNQQLNKYDLKGIYSTVNQIKLNTSNHMDANLPPQYLDSNQLKMDKQFNNLINNNPSINHCNSFANNIYALQQSNANSSNSSNNNICMLESQSSNGSRSCLTTPDSKSQPDLCNSANEINCLNVKTNISQLPNGRITINSNQTANSQLNGQLNGQLTNQQISSVNNNQIVNCSKLETNDVELLRMENVYLKEKLDVYIKKITKLQKLEIELQKVHQIEHVSVWSFNDHLMMISNEFSNLRSLSLL